MICVDRMFLLLMLFCCFSGCGRFEGEQHRGFQANLSRRFSLWTPAIPIAPGTNLIVTPVSDAPDAHVPLLAASVDGGLVLSSMQGNAATLWAFWPGTSHVEWVTRAEGRLYDAFSVVVEAPVAVSVSESITHAQAIGTDPALASYSPVHLIEAESPIAVVPGALYYVEVSLRGSDGGWIAHSPGVVSVSTADPSHVYADGFGVVITLDAGPTAFTLRAAGLNHDYVVEPHALSEAVSLELSLATSREPGLQSVLLAVATPRLDGGAPLHQAPIAFTTSPNLRVFDLGAPFSPGFPRRDVNTFTVTSFGDGGTPIGDGGVIRHHVSVTATAGALSVTREADVDVPVLHFTFVVADGGPPWPPADAGPITADFDGGASWPASPPPCGCESVPAPGVAFALLSLIARCWALRHAR